MSLTCQHQSCPEHTKKHAEFLNRNFFASSLRGEGDGQARRGTGSSKFLRDIRSRRNDKLISSNKFGVCASAQESEILLLGRKEVCKFLCKKPSESSIT